MNEIALRDKDAQMLKTRLASKQTVRLSEEQLAALNYLSEHGSILLESRDLTTSEREYVERRVVEIDRMDYVLASTKKGDRWTSQLGRGRRQLKKEIDVFYFERRILQGTWKDEKGRTRQYPSGSAR